MVDRAQVRVEHDSSLAPQGQLVSDMDENMKRQSARGQEIQMNVPYPRLIRESLCVALSTQPGANISPSCTRLAGALEAKYSAICRNRDSLETWTSRPKALDHHIICLVAE